ncbi:MAG: VOC family protein [Hyphomicrobiales bacterium]|nr:VOC family protein [Hyphomicrobiales bacterium]
MIQLRDVSYVRLGTPDIEGAESFATSILGLQVGDRSKGALYLRSDVRAHTLCYFEGDPADQTVGFEIDDMGQLDQAAAALEKLGHAVRMGTAGEAAARKARAFIAFKDPTGNSIEFVVGPNHSGKRYYGARDAGITGFSHIGLCTTNPARDEKFWTQVCNARVSDRIGEVALMRINAIHHTMALAPSSGPGIQHVNHQVESNDDVMRSYYFLMERQTPILFGPGRHPTSGARFVYFRGPDGMVFEYSVGVDEVDEATHRPRQFGYEPSSLCMWGSKADWGRN